MLQTVNKLLHGYHEGRPSPRQLAIAMPSVSCPEGCPADTLQMFYTPRTAPNRHGQGGDLEAGRGKDQSHTGRYGRLVLGPAGKVQAGIHRARGGGERRLRRIDAVRQPGGVGHHEPGGGGGHRHRFLTAVDRRPVQHRLHRGPEQAGHRRVPDTAEAGGVQGKGRCVLHRKGVDRSTRTGRRWENHTSCSRS